MTGQVQAIVAWIIVGLLAGLVASVLGSQSVSLYAYIIAGLVGAVLGGFLARLFKIRLRFGNPFLEQLVIAIIGAIVVLIIASMFM